METIETKKSESQVETQLSELRKTIKLLKAKGLTKGVICKDFILPEVFSQIILNGYDLICHINIRTGELYFEADWEKREEGRCGKYTGIFEEEEYKEPVCAAGISLFSLRKRYY